MFLAVVNHAILVYTLDISFKIFLSLVSVVVKLLGDGLKIHGMLDDLVVVCDAEAFLYDWLTKVFTSFLLKTFLYDLLGLLYPVLLLLCCLLDDLGVFEHSSQLLVILE